LRRPMQVPPRPSSSKKMATTWKGKLKHWYYIFYYFYIDSINN
jgi:hypothetical protein